MNVTVQITFHTSINSERLLLLKKFNSSVKLTQIDSWEHQAIIIPT